MEPYRPINTLKRVADEVWIVDGPIIAFRYLGLHLSFPTRMTVVRPDFAPLRHRRCVPVS